MRPLPAGVGLTDIADLVGTAMDELRVGGEIELRVGENRHFSWVGPPSKGDVKVIVIIEELAC